MDINPNKDKKPKKCECKHLSCPECHELETETKKNLDMARTLFETIGAQFCGVVNSYTKERVSLVYNLNGTSFGIEVNPNGFRKVSI